MCILLWYYNSILYKCERTLKGIVSRYKGLLPANEAAHAHAVNEHGAWRMAGKSTCRFKSAR